ncbi:MAG: T9SS type A sorting domain-containing protein [Cytophagales bacterium]|nr:T9SS type A sorting domain-containing protein [Cytophagales bacterium]
MTFYENSKFIVEVATTNEEGGAGVVSQRTIVELEVVTGTGTLSGVVRDTLEIGESEAEFVGTVYSKAESGVEIRVKVVSGDELAASDPVEIDFEEDPAAGINVLFFEDFENIALDPNNIGAVPTGFKLYNIDGGVPATGGSPLYGQTAWVVVATDAKAWLGNGADAVTEETFFENENSAIPEDTKVMAATSYFDPEVTADRWVVLPAITLAASGNKLAYQVMSRGTFGYRDSYSVYLSTTAPGTTLNKSNFELIPDQAQYLSQPAPSRRVEDVVLPIPDAAGGLTVYLAFQLNTINRTTGDFLGGGDRLFVDNITVFSENTLITDVDVFASKVFSVSPNPASTSITVSGAEGMVSICTIQGSVVLSSTDTNIDISALPAGLYLVKSGSEVQKLVVE